MPRQDSTPVRDARDLACANPRKLINCTGWATNKTTRGVNLCDMCQAVENVHDGGLDPEVVDERKRRRHERPMMAAVILYTLALFFAFFGIWPLAISAFLIASAICFGMPFAVMATVVCAAAVVVLI